MQENIHKRHVNMSLHYCIDTNEQRYHILNNHIKSLSGHKSAVYLLYFIANSVDKECTWNRACLLHL